MQLGPIEQTDAASQIEISYIEHRRLRRRLRSHLRGEESELHPFFVSICQKINSRYIFFSIIYSDEFGPGSSVLITHPL